MTRRLFSWQGKEISFSAAYGADAFLGGNNAAEALGSGVKTMYKIKKQGGGAD
jgi:hypothetical protein